MVILDKTAGLDTFLDIFSAFGITINPLKVLLYSVIENFIDNVEQIVQYIQGLARDYMYNMYTKQAQFTQNYRIGNIAGRF